MSRPPRGEVLVLKWLNLLLDDAKTAEAKLLREMQRSAPEYPDWSAAVQPVLMRLLERNQIRRPIICRVLGLPEFNALALPYQTIVLSQLLVDFCRDQPDQMAFVLAHELAHIHLGHVKKRRWANALMGVAPLANPLLGIGLGILFDRAYTREQEFEADQGAIRLLARAGYSATLSIAVLERLGAGTAPGNLVAQMLGTHPPWPERVRYLKLEAMRCPHPATQ